MQEAAGNEGNKYGSIGTLSTSRFPFSLPRSPFQFLSLLLGAVVLYGSIAHAEKSDSPPTRPFYSFNQSPLIQIYGLPALGEAWVLPENESTLSLHWQLSSHFTGKTHDSEIFSFDGETQRYTLQWRQGLARHREWGVELPYVIHGGGFLDRSIEEFHDLFGMPQNGRDELSRNRIDFRYTRDGVNLISLHRGVQGPGDVRLFMAIPAFEKAASGYSAAWRASLKLPTGDENELRGSGSTDLAVWLSVTTLRPDKWNLYGGAGALMMSEGKVLPDQQHHLVAFGTLGISRKFYPRFSVSGQLDAHSAFYEGSGLPQLGEYAVQGLVGMTWEFSPRKFLMFSASEDLIVGASPDVTFNLSLTLPF